MESNGVVGFCQRLHIMMCMGAELRASRTHFRGKPRPGRKLPVSYWVSDDGPHRHGETKNIGVGGAFIVTPDPEPVGTLISVELVVPDKGRLTVHSEVRWISAGPPAGMGLKFYGLEIDDLMRLNDYFASLSAESDEP